MADAFDKFAALFHDGRKFFKRCAAAVVSRFGLGMRGLSDMVSVKK